MVLRDDSKEIAEMMMNRFLRIPRELRDKRPALVGISSAYNLRLPDIANVDEFGLIKLLGTVRATGKQSLFKPYYRN